MRKTISITILTALLGVGGCNPDTYRHLKVLDGEIAYAPEGAVVEAIIKMPDGSIEKVKVIRWRQCKTSIAIETEDKEFLTGMNNVVMICEHAGRRERGARGLTHANQQDAQGKPKRGMKE